MLVMFVKIWGFRLLVRLRYRLCVRVSLLNDGELWNFCIFLYFLYVCLDVLLWGF